MCFFNSKPPPPPSLPKLPPLPPPRAMERLPQRGMVSQEARRQVTAGMGNKASGATVLGPAAASAQRGAGGVGSGLGARPEGVQGSNPASVAQPNTRAVQPPPRTGAVSPPRALNKWTRGQQSTVPSGHNNYLLGGR